MAVLSGAQLKNIPVGTILAIITGPGGNVFYPNSKAMVLGTTTDRFGTHLNVVPVEGSEPEFTTDSIHTVYTKDHVHGIGAHLIPDMVTSEIG